MQNGYGLFCYSCQSKCVAESLTSDLQEQSSGAGHDELTCWLDVQAHPARVLNAQKRSYSSIPPESVPIPKSSMRRNERVIKSLRCPRGSGTKSRGPATYPATACWNCVNSRISVSSRFNTRGSRRRTFTPANETYGAGLSGSFVYRGTPWQRATFGFRKH